MDEVLQFYQPYLAIIELLVFLINPFCVLLHSAQLAKYIILLLELRETFGFYILYVFYI